MVGSPSGEAGRFDNEGPVHEVCVDGFWLGKYEVTNGQYRKYKPGHSSKDFQGRSLNSDRQPAVDMSWNDAKGFAAWLSGKGNGKFRLPTEAEWEYAARAGTRTARYWGDSPDQACTFANVADQSADRQWPNWTVHNCDDGHAVAAPVGSFRPNNFGLYDMLGNAWEWCENVYDKNAYTSHSRQEPRSTSGGSVRVVRGGGWNKDPKRVRAAVRFESVVGGSTTFWAPAS